MSSLIDQSKTIKWFNAVSLIVFVLLAALSGMLFWMKIRIHSGDCHIIVGSLGSLEGSSGRGVIGRPAKPRENDGPVGVNID